MEPVADSLLSGRTMSLALSLKSVLILLRDYSAYKDKFEAVIPSVQQGADPLQAVDFS